MKHEPGPVAGAPRAGRRGATQLITQAGVEVRRIQKLRVQIVDQGDSGEPSPAVDLAQDEICIGSGAGVDLVIDDPSVSRKHLAIRLHEEGWLLDDLGSTNGSFIGSVRIDRVVVNEAVVVRMGKVAVQLQPLTEHVENELSEQCQFGRMLGASAPMREMFAVLQRVAASDLTLLIEGETGTGKELAAEAVHERSGRDGPLVILNCGAIPSELIESELMGHVRGAFTGAEESRPGAFVSAHKGTLFLDEVGELPIDMQAKLLRVLENQQVKAVGADVVQEVDVRVVAATNRDLDHEVAQGTFRQDLYYRLAVVVVRIPPLRTRRDDLPLLVEHVQEELNRRRQARGHAPYPPLEAAAMQMLARYDFPGNVRELRNIIERWLVLGEHAAPGGTRAPGGPAEEPGRLPAAVDGGLLSLPYHEAKEAWVERFERSYVAQALADADGNVSQAAREARVDRRHLQRLIVRYDITKP